MMLRHVISMRMWRNHRRVQFFPCAIDQHAPVYSFTTSIDKKSPKHFLLSQRSGLTWESVQGLAVTKATGQHFYFYS